MKIVITGGHVTPAVATIDVLKQRNSGIEFFYISRLHTREGDKAVSAEYSLMQKLGIPFYPLTTGRLQRNFTRHTIPSLFKIPVGFYQSIKYLQNIRPDLVLSFGGYPAVPVVIAARILGIKVVSHEQTLVPGLANLIISRFANVLALSFEDTKKYYTHVRTEVTGNPIRKEVFGTNNKFHLEKKGLPVIFVTGGNQGSHIINECIFSLLPQALPFMHIIHQTGNAQQFNDWDRALHWQKEYDGKFLGSYTVFDYVGPEIIGDIYSLADVVVARAGVNTMCELLALAKKAILIPIPKTSHNEQLRNAVFFAEKGLGIYIPQAELTSSRLLEEINKAVRLQIDQQTVESAKKQVKLDAAAELAEIVIREL